MAKLERATYDELIDLLTPFLTTEPERRALVGTALFGVPVLDNLNYTCPTRIFIVELINKLEAYSEIEPGKQALWALLEEVRRKVGVDKQRRIDALYDVINSPRKSQPAQQRTKPVKILIIDDDEAWQTFIAKFTERLGYAFQKVTTFEEAEDALKKAESEGEPFSIVTIDLLFEIGNKPGQTGLAKYGIQILSDLNTQYPYLGCIVITHSSDIAYHQVLDWRDECGLDYCIFKNDLDAETLRKGIERALARAHQRL